MVGIAAEVTSSAGKLASAMLGDDQQSSLPYTAYYDDTATMVVSSSSSSSSSSSNSSTDSSSISSSIISSSSNSLSLYTSSNNHSTNEPPDYDGGGGDGRREEYDHAYECDENQLFSENRPESQALSLYHRQCDHYATSVYRPSYVRLTHILDMDGFIISNQEFLCKELALVEISSGRVFHERFRLGLTYDELSDKEKSTVRYVSSQIHGIPFQDSGDETHDQTMVSWCLLSFLTRGTHPLSHLVVGYKGGNLESNILYSLGVMSFNMELIGCPKYDVLVRDEAYAVLRDHRFWRARHGYTFDSKTCPTDSDFDAADNGNRNDACRVNANTASPSHADKDFACPLHTVFDPTLERHKAFHCCRMEVFLFRRWYLRMYMML